MQSRRRRFARDFRLPEALGVPPDPFQPQRDEASDESRTSYRDMRSKVLDIDGLVSEVHACASNLVSKGRTAYERNDR